MSFIYFAYGSNLWPEQLCSRCPSATPAGRATLSGWRVAYDKPGMDGTAKMNLRSSPGSVARGVVYEVDERERGSLDEAEPGYTPFHEEVALDAGGSLDALTYRWDPAGTDRPPSDWYLATVLAGARHHGLDPAYIEAHLEVEASPDEVHPGMHPAGEAALGSMQDILASSLRPAPGRYTIHPGDLAWWMRHEDPRRARQTSYWISPGRAVLVIDADSREISAFSAEGEPVIPVIEWAQRRLRGLGEVGWVADSDGELVDYLTAGDYEPIHTDRLYHWELNDVEIPVPDLPPGWELRPIRSEVEADERRRASHGAFASTMDHQAHLERYLRFMRSPVYDQERDLVAVSPEGRIASFVVWWPDVSGIAQIEPFGTHPAFQRRGIGRALMYYALERMRAAGMARTRVITDESRSDATSFYGGVGFQEMDRVRWWRRRSSG